MTTMDYLTKRPRELNVPYSQMTDEMEVNIKKNPMSFFLSQGGNGNDEESVNGPPREGGRYYKDRYAYIEEGQIRGEMVEKYERNPPVTGKSTSQVNAMFKWGPNMAGSRTLSHYTAENVDDYLTIDCQRRPPTNIPGQITFKYGRPAGGYYEQKDPRGKIDPSPVVILERKTMAEYELEKQIQHEQATVRQGEWPEFSEYQDRYLLHSETEK